jgi:hypothetical protein
MQTYTTYWQRIVALSSLVLMLVVLLPGATARASSNPNPGIVPPGSVYDGKTYGEWSASWWQWAFSIPASNNPLLDKTGADCGAGQSGSVWFLAGVLNISGKAVRNECTVPANTALFFPVLNVEWDNYLCTVPDTHYGVPQLRDIAKTIADAATDMSATIDGVSVRNVPSYRAVSPVFSITLPSDNVLQAVGCNDAYPGTYSPAVGNGYYLLLAPLTPGPHTIHFEGTQQQTQYSGTFSVNITYHLTVAS